MKRLSYFFSWLAGSSATPRRQPPSNGPWSRMTAAAGNALGNSLGRFAAGFVSILMLAVVFLFVALIADIVGGSDVPFRWYMALAAAAFLPIALVVLFLLATATSIFEDSTPEHMLILPSAFFLGSLFASVFLLAVPFSFPVTPQPQASVEAEEPKSLRERAGDLWRSWRD